MGDNMEDKVDADMSNITVYAADVNGDMWVVGGTGEVEIDVIAYHVLFARTNRTIPDVGQGIYKGGLSGWSDNDIELFLMMNAQHMMMHGVAPKNAAKLAYLRLALAEMRLISPAYDPEKWNVRYNDAKLLNEVGVNQVAESWDVSELGKRKDISDMLASRFLLVTDAERSALRLQVTNLVCMLAYMFRVRAHHWLDGFDDKVEKLWLKCLYKENENMVPFQAAFTIGMHAIIPQILDDYWKVSVSRNRCAGTLIKRYNSAAAGSAAPCVIMNGVRDLNLAFPNIVDRIRESYDYLKAYMDLIAANRWAGSVNAVFYGQAYIQADESQLSMIAAFVKGAFDNLAPESDLKDSPALKRVALNAPITAALIGAACKKGSTREDVYIRAFLEYQN